MGFEAQNIKIWAKSPNSPSPLWSPLFLRCLIVIQEIEEHPLRCFFFFFGFELISYSVKGMSLAVNLPSPPVHMNGNFPSTPNSNGSNREGESFSEYPNCNLKLPCPAFKWRLVITYDGTNYAGWQFQQSPPTIQCFIERALTRVTKLEREDLHLVGAGRTDAGVHAWGQVAHFLTPFNYESLEGVHCALNGILPLDIQVREISPAIPEFHARFSVTSKVYQYKIYNDTVMDPFQRHYAYHSAHKLNASAMREAAGYFTGRHDFSAFANASRNDRVPNPMKNIFHFNVFEQGPLIQLEVAGSGFLYRQVRNMVALLLQIGREAIPPSIIPMILESRDRKELAKYALSLPPHGLCLMSVNYKEDHLRLPSDCPSPSFGRNLTISKCKLPSY